MSNQRYFSQEEFLFLLWKGIAFRTLSQEDICDITKRVIHTGADERQKGLPDFDLVVSFDDCEIEVVFDQHAVSTPCEEGVEFIRFLFS